MTVTRLTLEMLLLILNHVSSGVPEQINIDEHHVNPTFELTVKEKAI